MFKINHFEKSNSRQLTRFIDFPHDLYEGDPHYVPMLFMEQEALLNPKKSPFFEHSDAEYFLAEDEKGKVVGRIAGVLNRNHIQHTGKQEGFFGFFDVIDNEEVARLLLDSAANWLRGHGIVNMVGPANFSTNETVGLLIENFEEKPFIMMTYNAPYYATLLDKLGFKKHVDLLCWELPTVEMKQELLDKAAQIEERLKRNGYTIRGINMKNFQQEIENFLPVYNASWAENTGFVPMTDAEIRQIAKDLKPAVDPDFIHFCEKDGKFVGVALTVPNINEVQHHLKRGRLLSWGFLNFILGMKKVKSVRILALGTLKEYRRLGIDVVFYARIIEAARKKGIVRGEASWILEHNDMMNKALAQLGGHVYRKYRLYEKAIA